MLGSNIEGRLLMAFFAPIADKGGDVVLVAIGGTLILIK